MADWWGMGEGIAGFTAGGLGWWRSHRTGRSVRDDLDECRHQRRLDDQEHALVIGRLRQRISTLETEMVTLRKLLPGGEWYVKLGLEHHPDEDR